MSHTNVCVVSAERQKISVYYANYGRADLSSSVCPHSNTTLTSATCTSDQTRIVKLLYYYRTHANNNHIFKSSLCNTCFFIFIYRCDKRNACQLYISSLVYLDQCPHIHKYLRVFYTCGERSKYFCNCLKHMLT